MTNQEYFDKSVLHVLAQGCPAVNEKGACLYRTTHQVNGTFLKCGIGGLIPDDLYREEFEGKGVWKGDPNTDAFSSTVAVRKDILTASGADINNLPQVKIAVALQGAHDGAAGTAGPAGVENFIELYRERILRVARQFDLNTEVLSK